MEYVKVDDLITVAKDAVEQNKNYDSILLILDNTQHQKENEYKTISADIMCMYLMLNDVKVQQISTKDMGIMILSVKYQPEFDTADYLSCQINVEQKVFKGKKYYPKNIYGFVETPQNKKLYLALVKKSLVNAELKEKLCTKTFDKTFDL